MTYNVHSCVGTDRKCSPSRIAEVIAHHNPDIVALQELDIGLQRTGLIDQAGVISEYLKMDYHFHPSLDIERGQYGNAILSGHPMRLVRTGEMPTLPKRPELEKRGALWVEVAVRGHRVHVINTHLGLNRRERLAQVEKLLGAEWLGHGERLSPMILCGDLNAPPISPVYRRLRAAGLLDVQRRIPGHRAERTWPSALPFLRLDYVFVTADIAVRSCLVPRTPLTRIASDHLPLTVGLSVRTSGGHR